jgi:hypothetical protein
MFYIFVGEKSYNRICGLTNDTQTANKLAKCINKTFNVTTLFTIPEKFKHENNAPVIENCCYFIQTESKREAKSMMSALLTQDEFKNNFWDIELLLSDTTPSHCLFHNFLDQNIKDGFVQSLKKQFRGCYIHSNH